MYEVLRDYLRVSAGIPIRGKRYYVEGDSVFTMGSIFPKALTEEELNALDAELLNNMCIVNTEEVEETNFIRFVLEAIARKSQDSNGAFLTSECREVIVSIVLCGP